MTNPNIVTLQPEVTGPGLGRLGRHIEHDPRSRAFTLDFIPPVLTSKSWVRHGDAFNQGQLGSCTGNAMGGVLMTEPFFNANRILTQQDCVRLYTDATHNDKIPGHYPPDDTGSTGIGVAKAAKRIGWIRTYRHAFNLHSSLAALSCYGPVISGINWYEGFDKPQGAKSELVIGGSVRGGHEVELLGIDVPNKWIRGINSWGNQFGDNGYFVMSFDTFDRLLHERGDCTIPYL